MLNISPTDDTTAAAAGDNGNSRFSTGRNGPAAGQTASLGLDCSSSALRSASIPTSEAPAPIASIKARANTSITGGGSEDIVTDATTLGRNTWASRPLPWRFDLPAKEPIQRNCHIL